MRSDEPGQPAYARGRALTGTVRRCLVVSAVLFVGSAFGAAFGSPNFSPKAGGELPFDAIVGGHDTDGKRLYICRGTYGGGIQPGTIRSDFGGCNIPWGGKEITLSSYEVLVPAWAASENGLLPFNAVEFGVEPRGRGGLLGSILYVCRASIGGGVHLGKLRPEFGVCTVAYGGREITAHHYEVLVNPASMPLLKMPARRGVLPVDALIGGREADGQSLAICSAPYQGGLFPGKVRSEFVGCDISYGGAELTIPNYQVLVPQWQHRSNSPSFAVGGESGESLYVCRARDRGGLFPGKFSRTRGCHFSFAGNEEVANDYDLLTNPLPY